MKSPALGLIFQVRRIGTIRPRRPHAGSIGGGSSGVGPGSRSGIVAREPLPVPVLRCSRLVCAPSGVPVPSPTRTAALGCRSGAGGCRRSGGSARHRSRRRGGGARPGAGAREGGRRTALPRVSPARRACGWPEGGRRPPTSRRDEARRPRGGRATRPGWGCGRRGRAARCGRGAGVVRGGTGSCLRGPIRRQGGEAVGRPSPGASVRPACHGGSGAGSMRRRTARGAVPGARPTRSAGGPIVTRTGARRAL